MLIFESSYSWSSEVLVIALLEWIAILWLPLVNICFRFASSFFQLFLGWACHELACVILAVRWEACQINWDIGLILIEENFFKGSYSLYPLWSPVPVLHLLCKYSSIKPVLKEAPRWSRWVLKHLPQIDLRGGVRGTRSMSCAVQLHLASLLCTCALLGPLKSKQIHRKWSASSCTPSPMFYSPRNSAAQSRPDARQVGWATALWNS